MNKEQYASKRGIYLVANLKSENFCENLIHSIRSSGCSLPIRLIPFGGEPVKSSFVLDQVEVINIDAFSAEAQIFIDELQEVLTDCPRGYLLRFLAWFGDWDEFIYSDNDVVSMCNWEKLFSYLAEHDFVHADQEYVTCGKYNYNEPHLLDDFFGSGSLDSIFTAGHFVARREQRFVMDMRQAVQWFRNQPTIPKKHDQTLLHIASLIGKWNILNLCKPPHNWLSSWAGDYPNSLELIHAIQRNSFDSTTTISHIHYSGGMPSYTRPIEEFLFAYADNKHRLRSLIVKGCMELSGISYFLEKKRRVLARLKRRNMK